MSSFNMEMDKYLEKRSSISDISIPRIKPEKNKKRKEPNEDKSKSYLPKLSNIFKSILNVDEVIDLQDVDNNKMSVFELTTFKDKLSLVLKRKKIQNNKISYQKEEIDIKQEPSEDIEEQNLNNQFIKNIPKKSYRDQSGDDMIKRVINEESNDRIPKEVIEKDLKKSGFEDKQKQDNNSSPSEEWDEFRSDLRNVITITYKIMKKVPPEAIKNFKESEDFKKYVSILDKYKLLRKKED